MTASLPVAQAEMNASWSAGNLLVTVKGDLVLDTVERMHADLGQVLAKSPGDIVLDLAGVRRIDASGVALAVRLHRLSKTTGIPFRITGVDGDRKLLVELALRGQDPAPPPAHHGLVREIGAATIGIYELSRDLLRFSGEVAVISLRMLRSPTLLRWRDTVAAMSRHGNDAVPVVSLLGFLIGAIIAFQTFDPMAKYGAKLQVADVVAVSVVRELGPLITAIILAGRSGSAFAAEIGTMKVTQELDALRTFGIDPVRFLVIPRMLGTLIVTPFLAVYASLLGVAGGFLVLQPKGIGLIQYLVEVRDALTVGSFLQGLAKAAVFAIIVSGIGCLAGMRTGQGPGAVGLSTTRAVVAGIVAIIIADSLLGAFFYTLGI
jgi:phospholipid/cholesterol/gamma-HCH transport system permease protein